MKHLQQQQQTSSVFCLPLSHLAHSFKKKKQINATQPQKDESHTCYKWNALRKMPSVADGICTWSATFPGNSTSTQNLPAGTTLAGSTQPLDWDTEKFMLNSWHLSWILFLALAASIDNFKFWMVMSHSSCKVINTKYQDVIMLSTRWETKIWPL